MGIPKTPKNGPWLAHPMEDAKTVPNSIVAASSLWRLTITMSLLLRLQPGIHYRVGVATRQKHLSCEDSGILRPFSDLQILTTMPSRQQCHQSGGLGWATAP